MSSAKRSNGSCLAAELSMPVVIHDRDAHGEIAERLRLVRPTRCGTARGAPCVLGRRRDGSHRHRVRLPRSFALPVAFRSATGPRSAARSIAAGTFLVETDAPYLGPDPDGRNEPTTVPASPPRSRSCGRSRSKSSPRTFAVPTTAWGSLTEPRGGRSADDGTAVASPAPAARRPAQELEEDPPHGPGQRQRAGAGTPESRRGAVVPGSSSASSSRSS